MASGFDQEPDEKACTVTQALQAARRGLEQIKLTVLGEVSEVSDKPGYKAVYFTIRDDECALSCIMWRNVFDRMGLRLEPGMLVEVAGKFSCYPAKGRMQFSASSLTPAGEGKLRMQTALIARKLKAEGLMDESRKRPLPALPRRIAVVTSPRGKAVHDVIRTLRGHYPLGEVVVCGVPVEGAGAPQHIIEGLRAACAAQPAPDVILLVRGGGSYEDLMPFNDESLARAVAGCPIPVVTGIGHEPDNSLCDMVADRRCSTPTWAARAAALSMDQLQEKVDNATRALGSAFTARVAAAQHRLDRISNRPLWSDPYFITGPYAQRLDALADRLHRAIPDAVAGDARTLQDLRSRLLRCSRQALQPQAQSLALARDRLNAGMQATLKAAQAQLSLDAAKLDALSPLKVLARGYSIAYAPDGHTVIGTVDAANPGDAIKVQVSDGALACTVDAVERNAS